LLTLSEGQGQWIIFLCLVSTGFQEAIEWENIQYLL